MGSTTCARGNIHQLTILKGTVKTSEASDGTTKDLKYLNSLPVEGRSLYRNLELESIDCLLTFLDRQVALTSSNGVRVQNMVIVLGEQTQPAATSGFSGLRSQQKRPSDKSFISHRSCSRRKVQVYKLPYQP